MRRCFSIACRKWPRNPHAAPSASSRPAPARARSETQILDALERLLAAKPFTELTMDDIARQSGLSRSALYFYFASKEAALGALHQRTYAAMARTTDPLTQAGDATEADAAIDEVRRNWREHTAALRTFHETPWCRPTSASAGATASRPT